MERAPSLSPPDPAPTAELHGTAPGASLRLFVVHAPEDGWFVEGFLLEALRLPEDEVLVSSKLQGRVRAVVFSPDGARVATASDDHTAQVWDARSGQPVITSPLTHQGWVYAVAFSPDGTRVATASYDHTARVWDARSGEPVTPPLVHEGWVYAVAFGPDGTRVATASYDHTARVWDARSGESVTPPLVHQDAVYAVAFSPDGTQVATASYDHTARVWDDRSGQPVTPPLDHQAGSGRWRLVRTALGWRRRAMTIPRGCGTPAAASR